MHPHGSSRTPLLTLLWCLAYTCTADCDVRVAEGQKTAPDSTVHAYQVSESVRSAPPVHWSGEPAGSSASKHVGLAYNVSQARGALRRSG